MNLERFYQNGIETVQELNEFLKGYIVLVIEHAAQALSCQCKVRPLIRSFQTSGYKFRFGLPKGASAHVFDLMYVTDQLLETVPAHNVVAVYGSENALDALNGYVFYVNDALAMYQNGTFIELGNDLRFVVPLVNLNTPFVWPEGGDVDLPEHHDIYLRDQYKRLTELNNGDMDVALTSMYHDLFAFENHAGA